MAHVIRAQIAEQRTLDRKMMHRVMRHVVKQIRGKETRRERGRINPTHDENKEKIKSRSKRDADGRHHDEAERIARVIVMHAVKRPK